MSNYLTAYGAIYPYDARVSWDKTDLRRKPMIAELQAIAKARTIDKSASLAVEYGYADPGRGEEFAKRLAAGVADGGADYLGGIKAPWICSHCWPAA